MHSYIRVHIDVKSNTELRRLAGLKKDLSLLHSFSVSNAFSIAEIVGIVASRGHCLVFLHHDTGTKLGKSVVVGLVQEIAAPHSSEMLKPGLSVSSVISNFLIVEIKEQTFATFFLDSFFLT